MSLFESASLVITPNGTKASKLYSIKPTDGSGDLSVTRATTATRVNSSGLIESVSSNVPRLDYSNGSCPSILVEPQRTNLLTYSEDFTNVSWIKLSSNITSNATIAPDGTNTADKLIEDNTTANHLVQKAVVSSSASYTFSVFAKKAERNWVVLRSVNASFQNVKAWFNIDNGTIGTLENGATAKITNYSNGWYKLEMTIPSFSTGFEFRISTSTGDGIDSYLGTTGSGIYIWGTQLEAGSYATSYIPTTSATVTRNADVISKTGISSLIGQTEGTMFFDGIINDVQSGNVFFHLEGTSPDVNFQTGGGILYFYSPSNFSISTAILPNTRYKIAARYKNNDVALYINGVLIGTDESATITPKSDLYLNSEVGLYVADLKINSAVLWKTALTNAQLAELTTI